MTSTAELTLYQAVDLFLSTGLTGRAADTAKWYRERLHNLMDTIGPDRPLASITRLDLAAWYAGLDLASLYTLHGYGRAARRLFRWLIKMGLIDDNPATALDLPRLPRTSRPGISDPDLAAMLAAAADHPRDYAILQFIESTGSRLCGAAGLLLPSLDMARRRAIVTEKYGNDRTVFLSSPALAAMQRWLDHRPTIPGLDHVFIGREPGQPWHSLTPESIGQRFELYAHRAGITGPSSAHQWRHRFGRRMSAAGMNLGILSQIMGHSTPAITVLFYGIFGVDHLQEQYDRYRV